MAEIFWGNFKDRPVKAMKKYSSFKKGKKIVQHFSPSVQHFKNTKTMVQCEECNKWRLVFSKRVLKDFQRDELQRLLEETAYTCGLLLGNYAFLLFSLF